VRVHMASQIYKIILAIALAAWLPSLAFAMPPGQVYEAVKDSVVVVKAYDRQGKKMGLGSGVMLPSGDIITNYHVVKEGVRYTVGRGKQAAPATIKAGDPDKDLCLLTAPGLVAEPARLGRADRLKVGDPVYAVGAPQGLELSLSEGIISQLRGGGPHPIIQTTVAISPGSSGGGLFNAKGELVGITTFYLKDGQSLNFALPVEWINEVVGRKLRERPKKDNWDDRTQALLKAQDWLALVSHSREWIQAEPRNDSAWLALGIAYAKLGLDQQAIEALQEARRLNPELTVIYQDFIREHR
jgi:S1-C subfamily serine protease